MKQPYLKKGGEGLNVPQDWGGAGAEEIPHFGAPWMSGGKEFIL
jgi:hypothetical protein